MADPVTQIAADLRAAIRHTLSYHDRVDHAVECAASEIIGQFLAAIEAGPVAIVNDKVRKLESVTGARMPADGPRTITYFHADQPPLYRVVPSEELTDD